MVDRVRPLLVVGLVALAPLVAAAEGDEGGPLVSIKGYDSGPMEFAQTEKPVITVEYSQELDPARVEVRFNGQHRPDMLTPQPDAAEQVLLPLRGGKNRLVVEASSKDHPEDQGAETTLKYRFVETVETKFDANWGNSGSDKGSSR